MTILYYLLLTLLMFVSLLLILLVLIQKGRGGGLSSAFGGSGGSAAFGRKTGDVLTWATSVIFGFFIVLAVLLDLVVSNQYKSTASSIPVMPVSSTPLNLPTPPVQPATPLQTSASPSAAPTNLPQTIKATTQAVVKSAGNQTSQIVNQLKAATKP